MGIYKYEWTAIRNEIKLGEPKKDCFAYDDKKAVPSCRALTDLYCRKDECRFYKPGKRDSIVAGCKKGD